MAIEKRLHRILQMLPLTVVLGVDSDFSRYRYFLQLAYGMGIKENFVNQYLKGKVDVLVYPVKYGQDQYVKIGGEYERVTDMERAVRKQSGDVDAVIFPGQCLGEDYLFEIPGQWERNYEFAFENELYQIVFAEAFPYGKENFVELINEAIQEYPYGVSKKVLLYKPNIRYGATDVSSLDDAIDKTTLKLRKFVQDIQIYEDPGNTENLGKVKYDLSAQYRGKKAKEVENVERFFEATFEYDYSREATRFLNIGYEKEEGILSEQSFRSASDFTHVKNTDDVEKTILFNYLTILRAGGEGIVKLARRLYEIYLARFLNMEELEFDDMLGKTIDSIMKEYRFKKKISCPATSIEYLVLCNREGYIFKLKKCVNESIEKNVHMEIKKAIEQKLKECEARYL